VSSSHRALLVAIAVTALSGCEQWKAPGRIHVLEGRVDELSAAVSAMKGEPVGAGGSRKAPTPDGHGPAAEHADAATGSPPAAAEHAPAGAALPATPAPEHAAAPAAAHAKPHWGYNGAQGPAAWGALSPEWAACEAGKAQSPIDIEPKAGQASPITFNYRPTPATLVDNGHTLQVNVAPGSTIVIDGNSFQLVQFHVHTPSEHTIAGEHYPMELHLVHRDGAGKLAVVGIMYDAGAESKALEPVWSKWPKRTGVEDKLRKPFDPNRLLPETRTAYRYNGSLTTPPCSEGVTWNVLRRTMTDSKSHLDLLRLHYPNNARPVLPRGDRQIL
jgi:carbonic anhydrase